MKQITTDILIIGAGPAGLACAMELSKAKKDFIVIEKQSSVGGLSKTYEFRENDLIFKTDNGPHRFFSKNQYLYKFIEDLIEEDWITVERQTRQYIDGKFYDYPINIPQALKNIGVLRAARMGSDYFFAKLQYSLLKRNIKNFEDYVVANFGRALGEFNMINYTEKIWGIPSKKIHPDWAGQRIKGLNFSSLLKDAIRNTVTLNKNLEKKPRSLVDMFFYPATGTGLIYQTISNRLQQEGYSIFLNASPVEVHHKNSTYHKVIVEMPKEPVEITYNTLVESIPLPEFIKLHHPNVPSEISVATEKLQYRSQVYLFITLDKESITNDQWIYFPSKNIPIARVSEMKNFSPLMCPKGKTSLFVEFFCFEGDEIWNMGKDELFSLALKHFEEMDFFKRSEVRNYYQIKQKNVYPIYNLEYITYLSTIKEYLDAFENLHYIGRPGRFRYNNQDHSLEMGMIAAQSIIEGKRYDIESIGEEKEYFEKGSIPKS